MVEQITYKQFQPMKNTNIKLTRTLKAQPIKKHFFRYAQKDPGQASQELQIFS